MTADEVLELLRRLQGRGGYSTEPDSARDLELAAYAAGLAQGSIAVERAAAELFPDQADALLEAWEEEYRLPNDAARTDDERRARLRGVEAATSAPVALDAALDEATGVDVTPRTVELWQARLASAEPAASLRVALDMGSDFDTVAARRAAERVAARALPARSLSAEGVQAFDGSWARWGDASSVFGRSAIYPYAVHPGFAAHEGSLTRESLASVATSVGDVATFNDLPFDLAPHDVVEQSTGSADETAYVVLEDLGGGSYRMDRAGLAAGEFVNVWQASGFDLEPWPRGIDGSRSDRIRNVGPLSILRADDVNAIQDATALVAGSGAGNLRKPNLSSDLVTPVAIAFEAARATPGVYTIDDSADWRDRLIVAFAAVRAAIDIRPSGTTPTGLGTSVTRVFYSGDGCDVGVAGTALFRVEAGGDLEWVEANASSYGFGVVFASPKIGLV